MFLDIWLQGSRLDGLALLDEIKRQHPDLPVVMISGHGNVETAVSAIRRGAYDYIEKPFKIDRLLLVTQRAMEATRLKSEIAELKERTGESLTTRRQVAGRSISCGSRSRRSPRPTAASSSPALRRRQGAVRAPIHAQ